MYTVEECRRAWEATGNAGTIEERIARNARWNDYFSYMAAHSDCAALPSSFSRQVAEYMVREGALERDDHVLDIGAGVGDFSLAFAPLCRRITAMDMSEASLNVLESRAGEANFQNIDRIEAMWETFKPEERYDVTFSAMCPAICNDAEILRMESMTRRTCGILTVTRGSYDQHRRALRKHLNVKPGGGMSSEAVWYYDMLYAMGRKPNAMNWSIVQNRTDTVDALCARYQIYYRIFGIDDAQSAPVLREYFESQEVDGKVVCESQLNTALVWWNVR